MQDISHLVCNQTGCLLSSTGECLEGFDDPHRCPHAKPRIGLPNVSTEEAAEDGDEVVAEAMADWLQLPGGYELTISEAGEITARSETQVVMFAGEPDAGKTTLIATIYELLSSDVIEGFRFAGSETILAFERACFPSRIASGNVKPDTFRTRHPRPRFYHLSLRSDISSGPHKHLLLGDVSGETFRRASDDLAEAKKLHILRRVDAFVLILDGDKIRNRKERQDAVERATLILHSLVDADVLLQQTLIQVVISKFDCFDLNDKNMTDFLRHLRSEFETKFATLFDRVVIYEIAARPEAEGFDFGHGVREVMRPWLQESIFEWQTKYPTAPPRDEIRESDAFFWRRLHHANRT
jgi:hypothetical protein